MVVGSYTTASDAIGEDPAGKVHLHRRFFPRVDRGLAHGGYFDARYAPARRSGNRVRKGQTK